MPTYFNPTTTVKYLPISATHQQKIEPNESVATTLYLLDSELTALGLTKTLETPFARLTNSITQVVFSSAETQSVDNLLDSSLLRIKTNVDMILRPNDETNIYYYHLSYYEGFIDIKNPREIKKLYLTSEGAGTAYVMELLG